MSNTENATRKQIPTIQQILSRYMEESSVDASKLPAQKQEFEMTEYAYPIKAGKAALVQEKGFALSLHYIPGDPFEINGPVQKLDGSMDPIWQNFCNIYIKIELHNKSARSKDSANHAYHYLPFASLDGLFRLYNAIVTDTLFAYYLENRGSHLQNASDELAALYQHHFQDRSGKQCFHHIHCENYRTSNIPKPVSIFTVSYYPINQKGEKSLLPWELECVTMHFRALTEDELEDLEYKGYVEKPRVAFDENGYTTTAIRIPAEDLLTAIESIHYALCQWFSGKLLQSKTNA